MALIFCHSPNSVASGAHCIKVVEDIHKLSATEMYPKGARFQRYVTYNDIL